jgi:hypothetical protein
MKNHNLILILPFLLIINQLHPQIMVASWESCFGGTEWEQGNSVIKNSTGYLILGSAGSSDGDVQGHHGLSDSWLLQVDTVGNLLWSRCYGGTKGEYGEEILEAGNNQYYLTGLGGSENGDISFDPYPNSMDYWIVKIDSVGDIIWDKILGGNKIDWTRNAIVTNDGGVLTLGISTSDDGDISTPNGSWDLWMVKIDSSGEKQWDFSLGGEGHEEGGSVIQTSDGGYLITGDTDGKGGGNFDTTCNFHGIPGGGFVDAWVIKLDSLRNIEWQQCYGGTFHDASVSVLEVNDGYIVLGYTMSNNGDVSGLHGPPGNNDYGGDIWVFKIDKMGNLLWQNCLGGLYNDFARNIYPTTDGGYMIAGKTQSDDGDVGGFNGYQSGGYDDVWFAKIDSLGMLTWQYCYGGLGTEYIYRGVYQKSDYNYVITIGTETDEWQCNINTGNPDLRVVELYDTTVGVDEKVSNTSDVEIYPNPTNSILNIELPKKFSFSNATLEILNIDGKTLLHKKLTSVFLQIDVAELNNGLYFVKIQNNEKLITKKVIIQ